MTELFEKYQKWVVPVKRTLEAGVKVAWQGEGAIKDGIFEKFIGFLTRKTRQGVVVNPDQAIDRNTLLKMATNWGSEFMLKEEELGSLEPRKFADFLVLNQDYFTVPLEQFDKTYPLMTVVGGKIVYLRDEFSQELGMAPIGAQVRYSFEKEEAGR
ncbi:amidohydrolase family protein [Acidobacteria bacterium AH-259-D05]|nr:amidohydrolase family protein [Acidobacteria bacterium AH-259-D05]